MGQVLPSTEERVPGGRGGGAGQLLRRAQEYEVYRMEVLGHFHFAVFEGPFGVGVQYRVLELLFSFDFKFIHPGSGIC